MEVNTEEANATATNSDFEFEALNQAANYRSAILLEFNQWLSGSVLEIGAGVGQFSEMLSKLPDVDSLSLIEPDPNFSKDLVERGWDVCGKTSKEISRARKWSSGIMINVLEHIRDDLDELARLNRLLLPGGHLCILVPARPELYSPIDKDFGHFRRYTRKSLSKCMRDAGFEVVRCDYFNWLGYFAWAFTMKLFRQRSFSSEAVRFYDRVLFPPVHWSERTIIRPPFGQSLIAIGRVS